MAFPNHMFWEEGDKKGGKEPCRALLLAVCPGCPQHESSWHRRALRQNILYNILIIEKIIILLSLPRRPGPGLPSWSFHALLLLHWPVLHLQPHPWLPPWGTAPMYQLTFLSSRTEETWCEISCINAQFNWRALPSMRQHLPQKCLALKKVKNPEIFHKEYILWRKKIKSFLKDAEHFSVSSALTPVYLLVEVCII